MRLKEIRKAKGISQVQLALSLHMNQNTISRYETGEREPRSAILSKSPITFKCRSTIFWKEPIIRKC